MSTFEYEEYKPGDAVSQAQEMLKQQIAQKPGAYQSAWQTQLDDTIKKILNREKFSYDLNGDALYQQYKDQYTQQGKMAMMDTMGQAQAMTGGYGNSYAQGVGQQAYQGYLQQLNDRIPELYQLALNKYQMEGDAMIDQMGILAQQEAQDYGRYRDDVGDWQSETARLQDQYETERSFDYGKYADARDFTYGQYSDDRAYDYQTERDKVADEQWQKEFDEAVRQFNFANGITTDTDDSGSSGTSGTSGGSGSSGGSGASGGGTGYGTNTLSTAGEDFMKNLPYAHAGSSQETWNNTVAKRLQTALENGTLSESDAEIIRQKLGLKDSGSGSGSTFTYSDVAATAAELRKKGASANDIYQYISSMVNSTNYKPTNSASQDLAELKSSYVGTGR